MTGGGGRQVNILLRFIHLNTHEKPTALKVNPPLSARQTMKLAQLVCRDEVWRGAAEDTRCIAAY